MNENWLCCCVQGFDICFLFCCSTLGTKSRVTLRAHTFFLYKANKDPHTKWPFALWLFFLDKFPFPFRPTPPPPILNGQTIKKVLYVL